VKSKYGFNTTKERSVLMSKIKSKNTKVEIALKVALKKSGYKFKTNVKALPGCPDFVIPKHKLVLFVDGEFWHGYNWKDKRNKLKTNRHYWINKIERNMQRDKSVNRLLKNKGWKVVRFWSNQVKSNLQKCLDKVIVCI
jgi:DNA mismatch endonuclease (patch repair protein)